MSNLDYAVEREIADALWEEHIVLLGGVVEDNEITALHCAFPPDAPDDGGEFFTLEGEELEEILQSF